jgi:N-acetylglucosamine malate deacetylase 1
MNQLDTRKTRILILGSHPDDGLLPSGGTIHRLAREGAYVVYVVFSWQKQGFNEEEIRDSISTLKSRKILFNYEVRQFPRDRQLILDDMIKLRAEYSPDMIITHSSYDNHQDHETIRKEAWRAFKNITVLGFDEQWNHIAFHGRCFCPLTKEDAEAKMLAISKVQTQAQRPYYDPDLIRSKMRERGSYINEPFAESFELVRWVI